MVLANAWPGDILRHWGTLSAETGRVARRITPRAPTDPDVRITRIRLVISGHNWCQFYFRRLNSLASFRSIGRIKGDGAILFGTGFVVACLVDRRFC